MEIQSLAMAFLNGLISAMSACVYPLIPITTAIFGAGKTGHWLQGLLLSAIYVLGMAITYMTLGVVAALSGTIFGAYMGSPTVILIFSVIFFLLGLSFLDIIPLPIPNFGDKLQARKTSKFSYPLILGIFSGFIAAPCTAPLFGAILIDIAKNSAMQQSLVPGVVQALSFSLGMGFPFLLIGGFALKLPKPGRWMKVIKFIGATVLFTAGFHYLEDVIGPYPPEGARYTMALLGLALTLVFFMLSEPLDKKGVSGEEGDKSFRQKSATVFFLFIAAFGFFLTTSLLKPGQGANTLANSSNSAKAEFTNLDTAMKASSKNSILLIDFWAEWCTACHKMDAELFSSGDFKDLVSKYNLVIVRLDYTSPDSPEREDIIQKYQIPGFPTLLVTNTQGREIGRLMGFKSRDETIKNLEALLAAELKGKGASL